MGGPPLSDNPPQPFWSDSLQAARSLHPWLVTWLGVLVAGLYTGPAPAAAAPRAGGVGQTWEVIPVGELSLLGRAALSPDGRILIVAEAGGSGRLARLDLLAGRALRDGSPAAVRDELAIWRGEGAPVRDLAFTPDGLNLVSGGADGRVSLREVQSGRLLRHLRRKGPPVWALAVSGKQVAVGGEGSAIDLLPLQGGQPRRLVGHQGWVRALALDRSGELLASGGHDGQVLVWDLRSGARRSLKGHRFWVSALALSPDGKRLVSADWDHRMLLWDARSGKLVRALTGGHLRAITSLAFDAAGQQLASGSLDRLVVLWDLQGGRPRQLVEGHRWAVNWVGFSSADALLSVSSDGTARRWPLPLELPPVARPLPPARPGEVTLRNNTSGERLRLRLLDEHKRPLPAAAEKLRAFLRCGADDRIGPLDPGLLLLLDRLAEHFGRDREIMIISGFRSAEYNRLRTRQSRAVAKESQHMSGTAIDLRISGVTITRLRKVVKSWKLGGVGFYADSQFVHVDLGKVRSWDGE